MTSDAPERRGNADNVPDIETPSVSALTGQAVIVCEQFGQFFQEFIESLQEPELDESQKDQDTSPEALRSTPVVHLTGKQFGAILPYMVNFHGGPLGSIKAILPEAVRAKTFDRIPQYDLLKLLEDLNALIPAAEGEKYGQGVVKVPGAEVLDTQIVPPAAMVFHPKISREVLKFPRIFSRDNDNLARLEEFFLAGVLMRSPYKDPKWLKLRRSVGTEFTKSGLAKQQELINKESNKRVGDWKVGEEVDILSECEELAYSIIAKMNLGESNGEVADEFKPYWSLLQDEGLQFAINILIPPDRRIWKYLIPRGLEEGRKRVCEVLRKEIRKDRERRAHNNPREYSLLKVLNDYTDEEGRRLSEEDVLAQLVTLFFAGHDTSKNAMAWCSHFLAKHPEIQEQMLQELYKLENQGIDITGIHDEKRLKEICPITYGVIQETFRLAPSVPGLSRAAEEDRTIEGVTFKKGEIVRLINYFGHRDSRWSVTEDGTKKDPEAFDPSRWYAHGGLTEEQEEAFMPFGDGPGVCLGKRQAEMEMRAFIQALCRNRKKLKMVKGEADPVPRLGVTLSMLANKKEIEEWVPPQNDNNDTKGNLAAA